MLLSNELSEQAAHYARLASEYREKAGKPEYARMKQELLAVAIEWARLAEATAKEAEAPTSDLSGLASAAT